MPAKWKDFIDVVSSKLASQSIKNNQELAQLVADQYCAATVGSAQNPFGDTHQQGNKGIIVQAFKEGFDRLFKDPHPTFEEKEKNPLFADLTEELPSAPDSGYDVIGEFLKWANKNSSITPNYTYFQLFEDYKNYPKTINDAIPLLAKRLLFMHENTEQFRDWTESLPYGPYGDIGKKVYDIYYNEVTYANHIPKNGAYVRGVALHSNANAGLNSRNSNYADRGDYNYKFGRVSADSINLDSKYTSWDYRAKPETIEGRLIIKNYNNQYYYFIQYVQNGAKVNREVDKESLIFLVTQEDIQVKKDKIKLTRKLYQSEHDDDPSKIPSYITPAFIAKFTYDKAVDKDYKTPHAWDYYDYYYSWSQGNYKIDVSIILNKNSPRIVNHKISRYGTYSSGEKKKYFDELIRWVNSMADEAKKENEPDQPASEDPYQIMAKGILNYWKSTGAQPLSRTPAVPPCIIAEPQGGIYAPIYYGSEMKLTNNLRRAWNTGKSYKFPPAIVPAKLVATALAISFAYHLIDVKFIYLGGIPTSNGPIPMIGFSPTIF